MQLNALMECGGELNALSTAGYSPLYEAAAAGQEAAAFHLLRAGASLSVSCRSQLTALHAACSASHASPRMVAALLDGGADVEAVSDGLWTPLHSAAASASAAVVQLIVSRCSPESALLSASTRFGHWYVDDESAPTKS